MEVQALPCEFGVGLLVIIQNILGLSASTIVSSHRWMMRDLLREELKIVCHVLVRFTKQWVKRFGAIPLTNCKLGCCIYSYPCQSLLWAAFFDQSRFI